MVWVLGSAGLPEYIGHRLKVSSALIQEVVVPIKKGDVVSYHILHVESDLSRNSDNGIVLSTKKKEVAKASSKNVTEIVIAHTAVVMWDSGIIEKDVPLSSLRIVCKGR